MVIKQLSVCCGGQFFIMSYNLSVCMDTEWSGGDDADGFCAVRMDSSMSDMSAKDCKWNQQKNTELGNIAGNTDIKHTICCICLWTELEAAAFIRLLHHGRKHKVMKMHRRFIVQIQIAGNRF